jgi:hypothetical protein
LELGGTKITDAGLAHLNKVEQLLSLSLKGTKITDVGLMRLGELRKLRSLDVSETAVTAAGKAEFQQAFPRVSLATWSVGSRE